MDDPKFDTPMSRALLAEYKAGADDEQLEPLTLVDDDGEAVGRFQDGDYVIFYNIRGEREVQLSQSLVDKEFPHFERPDISLQLSTMIQYSPDLPAKVAFPPFGVIGDGLMETVSKAGHKIAKVCESEKAVHVTFFLNGKLHDPLPGEERFVAESPTVHDYGTVPELNCAGVGDLAVEQLEKKEHGLVAINFANTDVIGHVENRDAVVKAVEAVDVQVGRVIEAAKANDWMVLLTADHGSAEKWYYEDGVIDTGHTDSPVPCCLINSGAEFTLREDGSLVDVAPTILEMMGIDKPEVMTGVSLIQGSTTPPGSGEKRAVLLIVDGWGWNPDPQGNLIHEANTPNMDAILSQWPVVPVDAAGEIVGMPEGSVGNSETGHMHMASGRTIPADRVRINNAIADGSYDENPAWLHAMRGAKQDGTRLHLLGIVSFYSSHGSVDHLKALMHLAKKEGVPEVYIHSMLGRRGERPESGAIYIGSVEEEAKRIGLGKLVGVIGRFWTLDREYNWDRIEKSYRWLVDGTGTPVADETD